MQNTAKAKVRPSHHQTGSSCHQPFLSALHSMVSGLFLTSICHKSTSEKVVESYMEDTDCMYCNQTKLNETVPTTTTNKVQNIAQTW